MKTTSRWLPDSALTTYFGKPAFHAYGNGNTNPTNGGTIYGNYLKTHNLNPHSGDNQPEFRQVFDRAVIGASQREMLLAKSGPGKAKTVAAPTKGPIVRQPILPRKLLKDEQRNQVMGEEERRL
jgi:hypothetical protein